MVFKKGQIFRTKKGHKIEIIEVREGSFEVKMFSHKDSVNCKSYGWKHNKKYFISNMMVDGPFGLISEINSKGYKVDKISASIS